MKTTFNINKTVSAVFLAFSLAACSGGTDKETDDTSTEITEEDALSAAEEFTGGTAEAAEFNEEESYWEVDLELAGGGEAEAEVSSTGEVLEIKAEDGPFDYEISFNDEHLSLTEATDKALELQEGTVQVWEYKLGDDGDYFWEFYILDDTESLWEVKITADTGEEIEIELKPTVD